MTTTQTTSATVSTLAIRRGQRHHSRSQIRRSRQTHAARVYSTRAARAAELDQVREWAASPRWGNDAGVAGAMARAVAAALASGASREAVYIAIHGLAPAWAGRVALPGDP